MKVAYRNGITINKLIILHMKPTQLPDDGSSLSGDGSESEQEHQVPYFKCFSLSSVDLRDDTEQLSTQLDEFRTAPFSTCKSRFPPMIPLLQHFEVFLSSSDIKKVAQIVSSYCKKQKRNHRIREYVDDTRHLYSSLRQLIGVLAFDRVSSHIRNGETTMALGLAPSLTLRSMNCPLCRARKCLHLFCPECGKIFDTKTEVCKEFGIPLTDRSNFGKSSAIPKKIIKKHGRDIRNRNGVENDEGVRTAVNKKRSLNLQLRCDKAAINGIMELMKTVKEERYLMAYGGDIVLLLRNIAVASTGEPSDLATSCFRQVCARWMKGHKENKSKCREEDDSDDDEEIQDKIKDRIIKDTVEGLYVINKMLSSDTEDYKRLLNDTPKKSNIAEEQENPRKRRSKESSNLSSSDDYDSSDNEDNHSKTKTARVNTSKTNPSQLRAKEISYHSKSDSEHKSKIAKEDKYKPLIKMLELNKTSMATGDAPVYYNSDGEAIQVGVGLKSTDLGPSVRNQWGDRVSSRHLTRNTGDDSDSNNDLSHLSFKSGNQDKESTQSDSRKRKVNPVSTDAAEKCTGPSHSTKSSTGKKINDKLARSDEVSDVNPLLPPCDFTTATLVMRDVLSRRMRQHHDALFEFIPTLGDGKKRVTRGSLLPVTSASQCGGCGCTDNNKGRTSCTTCDRELKEHLDYSAVLDTMLWSYFFAKAEVEKSDLYAGYCRQMVQLLPLLRCYHTRQELGTTFFQWQCYFATHVIYYFSDYGQQALIRQLFSEEFRLIVSNLEYVTKDLKDAELVGEFVQCLKILQYTEEADPELEPMVREALIFLINRKRDGIDRNKKESSDLSDYDKRYKAYHTSYCASIGLLEYGFSKNEKSRKSPPVPPIFHMCVTYIDTD